MSDHIDPDSTIAIPIDNGLVERIADDVRRRLILLTVDAEKLPHVQFILQELVLGRLLGLNLTDGEEVAGRLINSALAEYQVPWKLTPKIDA
jgi:hypothetical protein